MKLWSTIPLALVLTVPSVPAAQEESQAPSFRSGVHVVEIDVRVFDQQGRFVTDLSAEDFEVAENGTPQRLQTAYLVGASATPQVARSPGIPADRATSVARGTPETIARPGTPHTWIFVFDLNHLTPGTGFNRAREAVETFVRDRFSDGDLGGIVAGTKMVNNRVTSVREELVAAARTLKPNNDLRRRQIEMTRQWPRLLNELEVAEIANEQRDAIQRAVIRACSDQPDACRQVPPDLQIREKARRLHGEAQRTTHQTLTAMNALAAGLAKMPGSKSIVFLSEGFVVQDIETSLRSVVGQIARSGGRVYAVDVRGVSRGGGVADILERPTAADEAGSFASFDAQEDGANSLAVDTGGLMIRNENNIGRALDSIAADARQYYLLAYEPTNTNWDGAFRSVSVKVRRPGVRVRARRGYLALEPTRLLTPQPVKPAETRSSVAPATDPGSTTDAAADPAVVPPPEDRVPAQTSVGVMTGVAPAAPSAGVRMRPDSADRIRELAEAEVSNAPSVAAKGWAAYQSGDLKSAQRLLLEAARSADVRPWVLYALGWSETGLGRPSDAAAAWERVRQHVPEFAPVYEDLASAYVQLSDLTKALAVLRDAEARWPDDPDTHNAIGVIHVRRGALDAAIEAFSRAAEVAPGEPLAYLNLGRAYHMRYMRSGRYIKTQGQWVLSEPDRRRAAENYQTCVRLGGPYAQQAADALGLLQWGRR